MRIPQWTAPAAQPAPTLDALADALAGIVGEQPRARSDEPFPKMCRAFQAFIKALEQDAEAYEVPEIMGLTMALDVLQSIFAVRSRRGRAKP